MEREVERELKRLAREAFKDQDFDELLIFLSVHKEEVPKNVWANGQVVIAFTILDDVWMDADYTWKDYGDEQCDSMGSLLQSILGKEEYERLYEVE